MRRLKTLFAYNSGQYIHLGIVVILSLLSVRHPIALALLFAEIIFLWKHYRSLMIFSLSISLIILLRYISFQGINERTYTTNQQGIVTEVSNNHLIVKKNHDIWYVYHNLTFDFTPGDFIDFQGYSIQIDGYNIPHNFDYEDYLIGMGIDNVFYATKIEVTGHRFHLNRIKSSIEKYIRKISDNDTTEVILLLLFGDDSYLDSDISNAFQRMGITHLFVISGMHIGLIIMMIKRMLSSLHLSSFTENIIIIIIIGFYSFLCGFSVSILRSSLSVILIFIVKETKLILSKIDILSFIMISFLLVNPYSIHLISFQLSFLLTFTIILLNQQLASSNEIVKMAKISTVATLFGLPIVLEMNGGFNIFVIPISIIFGLIVAKLILPGMFISILIPFSMPYYQILIKWFIASVDLFNRLSYIIHFNFNSDLIKTLYWIIIIISVSLKMSLKRILISLFSLILLVLLSLSINHIPNMAYIRVLDVGQGDAIHLHDSSCDILIDTGNEDKYDRLISYFEKSNIHSLDYLILTHRHNDHIGEVIDLQNALKIKNVISNPIIPRVAYTELISPIIGEEISCGNFNFQIIHYSNQEIEENNNSIVMIVEIYQHKWLLTGDIEKMIENKLDSINLNGIDVIKVPHHGSDTSSSNAFVTKVRPKYAVVSVGKNNQYNHPSENVIKRWEGVGATVFRTDLQGMIEFRYYKNNNFTIVNESSKKEHFHYIKRMIGNFK